MISKALQAEQSYLASCKALKDSIQAYSNYYPECNRASRLKFALELLDNSKHYELVKEYIKGEL